MLAFLGIAQHYNFSTQSRCHDLINLFAKSFQCSLEQRFSLYSSYEPFLNNLKKIKKKVELVLLLIMINMLTSTFRILTKKLIEDFFVDICKLC